MGVSGTATTGTLKVDLNEEERNIIWDALYGRRCDISRATRSGDGAELDKRRNAMTALMKKMEIV